MKKNIIVVDDFYDDFESYRAQCLTHQFDVPGIYQGLDVDLPDASYPEHLKKFQDILNVPVKDDIGRSLRLSFADDLPKAAVHVDVSLENPVKPGFRRWAAIIYLSDPAFCQGGLNFYKHKKTAALQYVIPNQIDFNDFYDPDLWELFTYISMRSNRCILFDATNFHNPAKPYGTGSNKKDGRLIEGFFFYEILQETRSVKNIRDVFSLRPYIIKKEFDADLNSFEIRLFENSVSNIDVFPIAPRPKDILDTELPLTISSINQATCDLEQFKKFILELEKFIVTSTNPGDRYDGGVGLSAKSLTAHFQNFNVFDYSEPFVMFFERFVKKTYFYYIENCNLSRQTLYIQCWANVLRTGEKINYHVHDTTSKSFLSGNFCVTSNNTYTTYYQTSNQLNQINFETKAGSLILFPSYLPHSSSALHEEDGERITIAFDLFTEESLPLLSNRKLRLFDIV